MSAFGKVVCTVLAPVLFSALTDPTTAEPSLVYFGSAGKSCGSYLAAQDGISLGNTSILQRSDGKIWHGEGALLFDWVSGFVTATNLMRLNSGHQISVDGPGLDAWMRRWCSAHPAASLLQASQTFVFEQGSQ